MTGYPRWDAYLAVATRVGGVAPRLGPEDPEHRATMREARTRAPLGWVVVTSHADEEGARAWLDATLRGRWTERHPCGCVEHYRTSRLVSKARCAAHEARFQDSLRRLDDLRERLSAVAIPEALRYPGTHDGPPERLTT